MKLLNQILRGVVIGVANIIPGVSGGTMMVSMGIYDTLIHCITHLFSEFKKSIKTLLPYAIGMLVGIVALASLLTFLFDNYPLPTYTAFIGLILGGLKPLLNKVDKKKLNAVAISLFVIFFALIVLMATTGEVVNPDSLTISLGQMLILLVMGCIASATMIIPGVSGSMVLMLLGYYTPILNAVSNLKDAVFALDFAAMINPILTLAPFGIGVVLGIFGVAKLIEWLLARFPTYTYCGVLGLVISSPVAILIRADLTGVTFGIVLVSLVTFAIGFAAAMLLAKHSAE
jgi:putative membrane protein